ncbi:MAG: type II toxin-antitoxin system VapC family toxin [Chthoniobacterales bacterium]
MIFCDTSTLAKYYVSERESAEVRLLFDQEDQVVFSELARIELMGVFHRRLREGKWNREEFLTVIQQFTRDDADDYWKWVPLESAILEQAIKIFSTLSEKIFLRSSDCLHLVTAMQHRMHQIYTHDSHQSEAASSFGLVPVRIGSI